MLKILVSIQMKAKDMASLPTVLLFWHEGFPPVSGLTLEACPQYKQRSEVELWGSDWILTAPESVRPSTDGFKL